MEGTIFDIQHFCTHDGPGIRTTVFLKGCPLKCRWCHNPESQYKGMDVMFRKTLCIECNLCINNCPEGFTKNPFKENERKGSCYNCLKCVDNCPSESLKQIGYKIDSEKVIEEVVKDIDYYKNSNGGITLSGGEPLFQAAFCKEILIKSKEAGLNTTVETSGLTSIVTLKEIIPYVDLFIWDIKGLDDQTYIEYTGVSFEPVIENLMFAVKSMCNIKLRFLFIPEIHLNDKYKIQCREFIKSLPKNVEIEIIPYHKYGISKSDSLGRDDYGLFTEPSQSQIEEFASFLY